MKTFWKIYRVKNSTSFRDQYVLIMLMSEILWRVWLQAFCSSPLVSPWVIPYSFVVTAYMSLHETTTLTDDIFGPVSGNAKTLRVDRICCK
jgi:hypothetical protein